MAPKSGARSHLDYEAQLAKLVDQPPAGEAWLHEQKFDGYRIGLRKDGAAVSLWSRRDNDWTAEFRSVAAAGAHLAARDALIDGEVAVLLPSGLTSFQSLQNRRAGTPLVYMAFDLLALDGADLRPLPVEERKGRLAALIGASAGAAGVIRYSDHIVGQGPAFAWSIIWRRRLWRRPSTVIDMRSFGRICQPVPAFSSNDRFRMTIPFSQKTWVPNPGASDQRSVPERPVDNFSVRARVA